MLISSIETNSFIKETMNTFRPILNPMKEEGLHYNLKIILFDL